MRFILVKIFLSCVLVSLVLSSSLNLTCLTNCVIPGVPDLVILVVMLTSYSLPSLVFIHSATLFLLIVVLTYVILLFV